MPGSIPKYITALCMLMAFSMSVYGQYEYLLHKPYQDKVTIIDTLYGRIVSNRDTASALAEIRRIGSFGSKHHDREVELEARLLEAYYYVTITEKTRVGNEDDIARLRAVENTGHKEKYLHIEARALRVIAEYYWRWMQNYELSFESYLRLNDLISTVSPETFPNAAEYYYLIGERYYFFQDYVATLQFLHKTLAIPETAFNWKARWSANNTLGLYYQKMNNRDSADFYFKMALQSKYVVPGSICYTIVGGNIADNLAAAGKYDEAIPLAAADYANAVKYDNEQPWRQMPLYCWPVFI